MADLRIIGVDDDGAHLVLGDDHGGRFTLAIDDQLLAAARRDRPRLGQLQIAIEGGATAKDVQALIRSGRSAEDAADRSGWTVEKVRRFEGPVIAERQHMADQARRSAVEPRGDRPMSLGERVSRRLGDRGVAPQSGEWDSARDDRGAWSVTLRFAAGGQQRQATWRFEPLGGSVVPVNDEARWLSEPDSPGPIPTPHVLPDSDPMSVVYDVEADGGVHAGGRHRGSSEPIDLMAAMRDHARAARRPRRRGGPTATPVAPPVDALPIEDLAFDPAFMPPPPPSRGEHPITAHLDEADLAVEGIPVEDTAVEDTAVDENSGSADERQSAAPPTATPRRSGRAQVPSWDDIVFGTRGRDGSTPG